MQGTIAMSEMKRYGFMMSFCDYMYNNKLLPFVFVVKRLRSPMLKFESDTYQYKPIHGNLVTWPYADVETPKGTCPFDGTTVGRGERSREERGDRIGLAPQMENCFPASPARLESGSNNTPRAEATGLAGNYLFS